jgi:hypothetical protein
MPSVYDHYLPGAFLYRVTLPRWAAKVVTEALMAPERPWASSFAITADAPSDMVHLWFSQASKDYLAETLAELANKLGIAATAVMMATDAQEHLARE